MLKKSKRKNVSNRRKNSFRKKRYSKKYSRKRTKRTKRTKRKSNMRSKKFRGGAMAGTSSDIPFSKEDMVIIKGIGSRPELNGQTGKIVNIIPGNNPYVVVGISSKFGPIKLKGEKLEHLPHSDIILPVQSDPSEVAGGPQRPDNLVTDENIGIRVMLKGLRSEQYNGLKGYVLDLDTNKEPPRFNILLDNGKMIQIKRENFDLIEEEHHRNVQFLLLGEQHGNLEGMMKNYESYNKTMGDLYKSGIGFIPATDVLYVSEGNGLNPIYDSIIQMSGRADSRESFLRDSIIEEQGKSYDKFLNSISIILGMYELMDTGSKDYLAPSGETYQQVVVSSLADKEKFPESLLPHVAYLETQAFNDKTSNLEAYYEKKTEIINDLISLVERSKYRDKLLNAHLIEYRRNLRNVDALYNEETGILKQKLFPLLRDIRDVNIFTRIKSKLNTKNYKLVIVIIGYAHIEHFTNLITTNGYRLHRNSTPISEARTFFRLRRS